MTALILISLGIVTGLVVSKSSYSKIWDVIMAVLGALTINSIITTIGLLFNGISLVIIMSGSVLIIHIGRFFKNLSYV
jgi:glycopeptide antibiotics resistance protein